MEVEARNVVGKEYGKVKGVEKPDMEEYELPMKDKDPRNEFNAAPSTALPHRTRTF